MAAKLHAGAVPSEVEESSLIRRTKMCAWRFISKEQSLKPADTMARAATRRDMRLRERSRRSAGLEHWAQREAAAASDGVPAFARWSVPQLQSLLQHRGTEHRAAQRAAAARERQTGARRGPARGAAARPGRAGGGRGRRQRQRPRADAESRLGAADDGRR